MGDEMSFIIIVRWVVSVILGMFWLYAAVTNLVDLINARVHKSSTSLVLFFGGVAGVVAMLACPIPGTTRWAWVPAVLDLGCVPAGLTILFAVVGGKFKETEQGKEAEPTKDSSGHGKPRSLTH
jgi:uncharacterized membrane protein